MKEKWIPRIELITSMALWGTLSLFVKPVSAAGVSSAMTVWIRSVVGMLFLLALHFAGKKKFDLVLLKKYWPILLLSGTCMAFNWILLFESYNHTTVSVSTVCYYTAPVIFMIGTFFVFKEKVTVKKIVCILLALTGMFLVSFNFAEGFGGMVGILCASGAAVLYASVILMNKFLGEIPGVDRTFFQLLVAVIAVLPYVLLTKSFYVPLEIKPILCLLVLGSVHTGFALTAYFHSVTKVPSGVAAMFSYLDPVIAVLMSVTVLGEPITVPIIVGILLIIGASVWSEMPEKKQSDLK